jgi:hypothetical protein
LPKWLKEPEEVKAAARPRRRPLREDAARIYAKLALSFPARTLNRTRRCRARESENIRNWAKWIATIDEQLLREVQEIFRP